MPDLSVRSNLPEKMDMPGVPGKDVEQALGELAIINTRLSGYNVLLQALNKMTSTKDPFQILDFGAGGGDTLRAIAAWASRHHRTMTGTGIDFNSNMTRYSERRTSYQNLSFMTMSVLDDRLLEMPADFVTASLFLHHFDGKALLDIIRRMYRLAGKAVIINDLHRHPVAYYAIRLLTRLFSKSYLVRYDAPLSVARAFSRKDWEEILTCAGIKNYSLKWRWAWRWQLIILKENRNDTAL